jgi:Ca-activated chloride channel homolog
MSYFAFPKMFFWMVAPVALTIVALWGARVRRRSLCALGHPDTIQRMLPPGLGRRRAWMTRCFVLGLVCWVVALAGPLLGARLVEFKQRGLDVFIAVDCSSSMLAEDLKPNRMAHAKLILAQLIDRLHGDRLGMIAFAGQAYIQCPLTIDTHAAKQALEVIDTHTVPIPGTVIGDAIRTALKGLKAGAGGSRVLILLTDGEDHRSEPLEAAKEAARAGLKIYPVGIGGAQGEPIPIFDDQGRRSGYKRDKKGEVVLSRADEKMLLQLAHETGGEYFRASGSGDEVDRIAQALDSLKHGDQKTRWFNRFENRYQWPLAVGWLLILIGLTIPERGWRRS